MVESFNDDDDDDDDYDNDDDDDDYNEDDDDDDDKVPNKSRGRIFFLLLPNSEVRKIG